MKQTLLLVAAAACCGPIAQAQTLLAPQACQALPSKSPFSLNKSTVTVFNSSLLAATVLWVDSSGVERSVVALDRGRSAQINTGRDAVLVVRRADGACTGVFPVSAANVVINVTPALLLGAPSQPPSTPTRAPLPGQQAPLRLPSGAASPPRQPSVDDPAEPPPQPSVNEPPTAPVHATMTRVTNSADVADAEAVGRRVAEKLGLEVTSFEGVYTIDLAR